MQLRGVRPEDIGFLQQMLYAAAFWRPVPPLLSFEDAMRHPGLEPFHEDWGRAGDRGFVAERDGSPIGAAWYRLFTEDRHGEGYIDARTPEIAIAVLEDQRGRGVGRALMQRLIDQARTDGLDRVCLSVNADNPAKRLYEALGFTDLAPGDERMVLELR